MIPATTFVLAFCSVVYELLLGQTLSAFLGNTVLRYSVTIGLYMLSMGIGAWLVRGPIRRHPVTSLLLVELLLASVGGYALGALFLLDAWGVSAGVFSAVAHGVIILIGVLTGAEIPLLVALGSTPQRDTTHTVLGVDYLGAFAGTITFAFWFYPVVGLVPTALGVALMNATVGLGLALVHRGRPVPGSRWITCGQAIVFLGLITSLVHVETVNRVLADLYLGT